MFVCESKHREALMGRIARRFAVVAIAMAMVVALPGVAAACWPGTGTPGYWHKVDRWDHWGIDGVAIGGVWYTADEAVEIINMPVKGDKTLTMFPALVAAKLNVAIGNPSGCINWRIDKADEWMAAHPPESGVKANSDAWDVGERHYLRLDAYNNGYLCAPPRD